MLGEKLVCAVEESAGMGSIEEQTREVLQRLSANVKSAGFAIDGASATQLYLGSVDDFEKMNSVYSAILREPRPARATMQPAEAGGGHLIRISMVVSR